MTQPTINPYEPTSHTAAAPLPNEPLKFNGTIERSDYQDMLPRDQEWWLIVVLAVLLGIIFLVLAPVSVLLAISKGKVVDAIVLLGFCVLILAALWFLKLRICSIDRVNRMLKNYPDVLGNASGELSETGLTFCDGVHTHWFGPQHMQRAAILKDGVRFSVDSMYRYLALNARLFDCYDLELANGLKRRWTELAALPVADDALNYHISLSRIGPSPDDAIHFEGQVITEINMRTAAHRNKAIVELLSYLAIPAIAWFFLPHLEAWMIWTGISLVIYGLFTNILLWTAYYRRPLQQSSYQCGWISQQEFATCNIFAAARMPFSDVASKADSPDGVVLTLKNGQPYHLPRHLVASEEGWDRLRALRVASPLA